MKDLTKTSSDKVKNASRFDLTHFPQSDILANSLDKMFPEQAYEDKTVQKAKEILGDNYSTEDIKDLIASYEYLIGTWFEDYEKKVFNDKTLKEILSSI